MFSPFWTFWLDSFSMGFPKTKITIPITFHLNKKIVLSLDWKETLNLRNSLCIGWGPCARWCSVDRLASLTLLFCDCSSQFGKDIWPLKCSQEGKIRGWCSSGELIKGSMGNEEVRTVIRGTFEKFGLGEDRSMSSGLWFGGRIFSKMRETWLYLNADGKELADKHC